jgi:hypothetical protein
MDQESITDLDVEEFCLKLKRGNESYKARIKLLEKQLRAKNARIIQ